MTDATQKLFTRLIKESHEWESNPMWEGTKEECGNLADLKKQGLVETYDNANDPVKPELWIWVYFTEKGHALADRHSTRSRGRPGINGRQRVCFP